MNSIQKYYGLALAAGLLVGTAIPAAAWPRNPAETLAVLPAGASAPEGLTVGADGNLYVTTFGYDAAGEVAGPGHLYVFTPDGQLIRDVTIQGSTSHQLGIAFNPATSELLAIDAGAGVVRRVDPQNGAASVFMTAGAGALLNGLAFDPAGNTLCNRQCQRHRLDSRATRRGRSDLGAGPAADHDWRAVVRSERHRLQP